MTKKRKENKKTDKGWHKTMTRVFVVIILLACVVGFSLSFSFFSIFKTVEQGDYAIVYYTLSYEDGIPIITSDQTVYQNAIEEGLPTAYTSPLTVQAGALQTDEIIPIEVYQPSLGYVYYALLNLEVDSISDYVIGMHANDVKEFDLEFAPSLAFNISAAEFDNIEGLNFSDAQVGMVMFPTLATLGDDDSENATSVIRPAVITKKTDDNVTLQYGYPKAEIQVTEIE